MSTARFVIGNTCDVLATLDPASVDLVFSSPPFLALRSYLPADHPAKALEIGSERTPADFLDVLLDVTEACARVLAPHGSLIFELGDTYSGAWSSENTPADERDSRGARIQDRRRTASEYRNKMRDNGPRMGWPLDKSLCGIPTLFAWSLAYGRNLLRPERTTDPWRIRNLVVWARPNPPVGALGDKFRPATSYLTVATKARARFDVCGDARVTVGRVGAAGRRRGRSIGRPNDLKVSDDGNRGTLAIVNNDGAGAGAPPLDYWEIPTQPYKGAHYATFPERLVERPLLAMCPQRVCTTCGLPSRRITEATERYGERMGKSIRSDNDNGRASSADRNSLQPAGDDLAERRVGMFLTVEHHALTVETAV